MQKPPVAGDVVRVVTSIGSGKPRGFYAYVLNVSALVPELVGTSGEPTISIVLLEPTNILGLSRADWQQQLQRYVGVHHWSHPSAIKGLVNLVWVDVLPSAEGIIDKSPLPPVLFQVPGEPVAGSPMPVDPPTPVRTDTPAQPSSASGQAAFTRVSVDCIGDGQQMGPAGEIDVLELGADIHGPKVSIALGSLKVGDVLPVFNAKVTAVKVEDGVLEVATETLGPKPPSAADLDAKAAEDAAKAATGGTATGAGGDVAGLGGASGPGTDAQAQAPQQ